MVIGIDIALNTSGVAVKTGDEYQTSLITVKPHWDYYRKLSHLQQEYRSLFSTLLTPERDSHILVLEGRLRAGWSANTMASIEGARVTVYLAFQDVCNDLGITPEVRVYDPNDVKKFIAGKRTANKTEMHESAVSRFSFLKDIEFQEDKFDAIYLCLYHEGNHEQHPRRDKKSRKL